MGVKEVEAHVEFWQEELKIAESMITADQSAFSLSEAMKHQNRVIRMMAKEILRLTEELERWKK